MKCLRKNKLPTLPKPLISEAYESNLCCGHLNVQGLGNREPGKYLDLLNETDIQQLDVLCISETHLKKHDDIGWNDLWREKEASIM